MTYLEYDQSQSPLCLDFKNIPFILAGNTFGYPSFCTRTLLFFLLWMTSPTSFSSFSHHQSPLHFSSVPSFTFLGHRWSRTITFGERPDCHEVIQTYHLRTSPLSSITFGHHLSQVPSLDNTSLEYHPKTTPLGTIGTNLKHTNLHPIVPWLLFENLLYCSKVISLS